MNETNRCMRSLSINDDIIHEIEIYIKKNNGLQRVLKLIVTPSTHLLEGYIVC